MFDNPASQRQIELYASPMVKRYRIDPSSVQLTASGYGKADVYLTYLAEKGAPKVPLIGEKATKRQLLGQRDSPWKRFPGTPP